MKKLLYHPCFAKHCHKEAIHACGGCRNTYYCSTVCMKRNYSFHKALCMKKVVVFNHTDVEIRKRKDFEDEDEFDSKKQKIKTESLDIDFFDNDKKTLTPKLSTVFSTIFENNVSKTQSLDVISFFDDNTEELQSGSNKTNTLRRISDLLRGETEINMNQRYIQDKTIYINGTELEEKYKKLFATGFGLSPVQVVNILQSIIQEIIKRFNMFANENFGIQLELNNKLGDGGYGIVYKTCEKTKCYALKIQIIRDDVRLLNFTQEIDLIIMFSKKYIQIKSNDNKNVIYDESITAEIEDLDQKEFTGYFYALPLLERDLLRERKYPKFGCFFIELMDGSLEDLMQDMILDPDKYRKYKNLTYIPQILRALIDEIHSMDIIHADLLPKNIMYKLDNDRKIIKIKIIDFGIAVDIQNNDRAKYNIDSNELRIYTSYNITTRGYYDYAYKELVSKLQKTMSRIQYPTTPLGQDKMNIASKFIENTIKIEDEASKNRQKYTESNQYFIENDMKIQSDQLSNTLKTIDKLFVSLFDNVF